MLINYQKRTLENVVNFLIGKSPIIMITGPRQVGKTTLIQHLVATNNKNIKMISLDNLLLQQQAKEDPELFLRTYETPLIIDEFQKSPELLSYMKLRVDEARKNAMFGDGKEVGTMYYLTGSQVFDTMEGVSDSLSGRVSILNLYGFSARELEGVHEDVFVPKINDINKKERTVRKSVGEIYEQILRGSYPEVVNQDGISRELFYESYIRTYLERDVRKLINIKDEFKFIKFISSVAARTAQEFNESDLARDVEVDNKTISEWMSILKNTHLVYLLQSYSNNNVQKAIKRPKMYFMDTGLACYLTGYMNAETLLKSAYNGAIFETFIVTEIIKTYTNAGLDPKKRLYYYRDSNGKEIDLLVVYDNVVYPVEIKKSANPGKVAIKNFDVVEKFGLTVGNGIVLCLMQEIVAIDENNYYVPIEYI